LSEPVTVALFTGLSTEAAWLSAHDSKFHFKKT